MIRQDYWNIRPHTQRKLDILDSYLHSWCDIIFAYYRKNPKWEAWKTPYYIDCFSGRGMYHKDSNRDFVKGSPIVAIEKLITKKKQLKEKYGIDIFPKARLIEFNESWSKELEKFVSPYMTEIDIKVFNKDFNSVIQELVNETGFSPTFFFVDAGGIKELKKESVDFIVRKKGARDVLLNYVVDGPKRIGGLGRSLINGSYKGKKVDGAIKTIERLQDFTGMDIGKYLEQTKNENKEALFAYVQNVLHSNNKIKDTSDRLTTVVYDMKDLNRQRLVYYLLFSSRKSVATEIMKSIFRESKASENNQASLFGSNIIEIGDL
jgi:three-Cys-motif partner protein